jgi:hypothetical protein
MTAQQIAGPQAISQMMEALAQAPPAAQTPGQAQTPSTGPEADEAQAAMPGAPEQPLPGPTSPLAAAGGVSTDGEAADNQPVPDGPLEMQPDALGDSRTADSDTDAETKLRMFEEEPWFAKLPPTLRKAIQARVRRRPPRGYEEWLRRYFESID